MAYSQHHRRTTVFFGCLAKTVAFVVLWCTIASPASARTDLLNIPAKKSKLAECSPFLDVAKTGNRLVVVGRRGHIMYSDNQGTTWTQANVPVRVTFTAVQFPTDENGWAVGHDGVVLHSTDRGMTWIKQLDGFKINELELELYSHLVKEKQAELTLLENSVNSPVPENTSEHEIKTDDHKKQMETLASAIEDLEFKLEDVRLDSEEGAWKPLLDLHFDDDRHGIVVGVFGTILCTGDGGHTWRSLSNRIHNPDGYHYKNITRAGKAIIIGGEIGNLYRSLDNGETWHQLESSAKGSFFGLIANTSGDIVVGTSFKGQLVFSRDQGATWKSARAKTMATLADGTTLENGALAVVSYAGEVFKIEANSPNISIRKIGQVKFPGMISAVVTNDAHFCAVGQKGVLRFPFQ